jgi:hypothetical protein
MTGKDWDFTARSLDAARDKYIQKFSGKYNERQREARRKKSRAAKDHLERGLIDTLNFNLIGMEALAAAGSAQSLMCEEQGVVD